VGWVRREGAGALGGVEFVRERFEREEQPEHHLAVVQLVARLAWSVPLVVMKAHPLRWRTCDASSARTAHRVSGPTHERLGFST
jgi:hypothetical protein